ncbi:MAG: hypothetical protein IT338_13820 [Thermomicrobiales bacterium]|nr:hypothetical protein [Thermomicrobiales bacterium]
MTDREDRVEAAAFRSWLQRIEEIVALDAEDLTEEDQARAMLLLHDLIGVGLHNRAIRAVVTHSSGPLGLAHLAYRYPINEAFDWSGEIEVTCAPWHTVQVAALISDLERAAGLADGDLGIDHKS